MGSTKGANRLCQEPEDMIMPSRHTPVLPRHPVSMDMGPTMRRSNQWALEFGDGGGMPVHPPYLSKAGQRPDRGLAGWAAATAIAAVLALGIAVELLPTRAPEVGAVDAAAKVVDAAAARMEAAAAHLQRLTHGERS